MFSFISKVFRSRRKVVHDKKKTSTKLRVYKKPISIKFQPALLNAVDNVSAQQGKTRTQFIEDACRKELDEMGVDIITVEKPIKAGFNNNREWAGNIEDMPFEN